MADYGINLRNIAEHGQAVYKKENDGTISVYNKRGVLVASGFSDVEGAQGAIGQLQKNYLADRAKQREYMLGGINSSISAGDWQKMTPAERAQARQKLVGDVNLNAYDNLSSALAVDGGKLSGFFDKYKVPVTSATTTTTTTAAPSMVNKSASPVQVQQNSLAQQPASFQKAYQNAVLGANTPAQTVAATPTAASGMNAYNSVQQAQANAARQQPVLQQAQASIAPTASYTDPGISTLQPSNNIGGTTNNLAANRAKILRNFREKYTAARLGR